MGGFSKPTTSLLCRYFKLRMEQEGKGIPLHVSHQPKDHKPGEGRGATPDVCSLTGGLNLQLKLRANDEEKQQRGKMTQKMICSRSWRRPI